MKIADLGIQFKDIGLDKVQFITIPNVADPSDPNRLVWAEPQATNVWTKIANDEPLTKKLALPPVSMARARSRNEVTPLRRRGGTSVRW